MTYETITLDINERFVASLCLSRPEKHNALSAQMIDELTQATQEIAANHKIRLVILSGNGPSFCAGGDLIWMREQFEASRETRIQEARKLAYMLKALNELPMPLLGRVHGRAFGGGVGLMSVCDKVIASSDAKFGLTEVKLGLIPATISPYVIRRIQEVHARHFFQSAEIFDADYAQQIGLATHIVSAENLDKKIEEEVDLFLKASPAAMSASKQLVRSLSVSICEETIESTIQRLADTWETADAKEGISAFFEKRHPNWSGHK